MNHFSRVMFWKQSCLLLPAVLTLHSFLAGVAGAEVVNIQEAPFSALADGTTDDRPALARALAALESGDTLLIPPGTYRIVLAKGSLTVPAGVAVLGLSGKSKFMLSTDGGPDAYREFLRLGTETTLQGLTIERGERFPAVLFPVFGNLCNVALRDCRIVGNVARFPGVYCHGIQVGVGKVKNLVLRGLVIEDCTYGLFQASRATGSLDRVTVEHCRFERNTASDLEFNSPHGDMRNITVRHCSFLNNLSPSPGAGFAVGFANVKDSRVEGCRIENYGSEALHVEDRSANIHLSGNTIVGGSKRQPNGVVMVLSGSKHVVVESNFIDGRPNTNQPHLVLVTAGGNHFVNPSDVLVSDNVLVNGSSTKTWYLQPGSGPPPTGNLVLPGEAAAAP